MKQVKILVFPCGSEVALEIHRALKDISFITLWGASSVADHGKIMYKNYVEGLPMVYEENFVEQLNRVLTENHIDYVYPAMDQVMDVLSAKRNMLRAELIAPSHEAVTVCRNKARTYARLAGLDFMPVVYSHASQVERFPVAIKPQEGYGAKGFQVLNSPEELAFSVSQRTEAYVLCEYLRGEEYTVDCFTNRDGDLLYVNCRNRKRIRNGISVNSRLQQPDNRIREIAIEIGKRIPMRGAWFFQLKRNDNDEYKLLEVATRIAGTMCVQRGAGVNLPLMTVLDQMGQKVSMEAQLPEVEVDRALYNAFMLNRQFTQVYVDFQNVLVINGRVNAQLMRFLYQCRNQGLPVTLFTEGQQLQDYCIHNGLFQNIHVLPGGIGKEEWIQPDPNAVYICNSYTQRRELAQRYGVAVLGADCVECLIDYRQ